MTKDLKASQFGTVIHKETYMSMFDKILEITNTCEESASLSLKGQKVKMYSDIVWQNVSIKNIWMYGRPN